MKKAYPKYKSNDIPWLPSVPGHWDQVKFKYLFSERVDKGHPEEPLLAATQTQGVIPKDMYETRTVTAQKDFHLLKLVKKGDFVISLRSFQGGIEYAYYQGIISPAYTVLEPLKVAYGGYFKYLLKSKNFIDDLTTYVTGIREGQNINYGDLRNALAPLPPLPEQRQIAAFLDHKCRLIDTFIEKKTRLIELLKEQKQAIINKAVTRGIDPNVRLKPSGIDWLGDIPEHWEVKKLKYVANLKSGSNLTSEVIQEEGSYPVYGGNGLRGYYPEYTHEGDFILIGRQGALCGNINFAHGKFWPTEHAVVVYIKNGSHYFWLGELLRAMNLNQYSQSAAQPGLSVDNIKNLSLPLPSHDEQNQIAEYLRREFAVISRAITRIEREIELTKEYKTTLIAEAVTGKIDVRDWTPKQQFAPKLSN